MGEKVVVTQILSEVMIKAGTRLIEQLDKVGLPVEAALWLYIPEAEVWRFVISLPDVKLNGPKQAYEKVQSALSTMKGDESEIGLQNISVVDTKDSMVTLLRHAIRTGAGTSGIRFSRNIINGTYIEDAYIYRLS